MAQNVLAVGSAQVAITVVPLITLPYLARVLDRSELGLVVIAQTFSFLVALLVEYGFSLSGTRDVARRRDDREALGQTVAGVQGAKVLLAALALALSLALWPLVPVFRDEPQVLAYGAALGVLQGFIPIWYFVGIERAHVAAVSELTSRLGALLLIVLLVHDERDGEVVLAIYVATAALSVALLTALMYRRTGWARHSRARSMQALRRGRTLFGATGATAGYTGANPFLLAFVVPAAEVAVFAAAEKVVRAGTRVLGLTAQAVYPRASRLVGRGYETRAARLSSITLALFGGVSLAAGGLTALFARPIVEVVFGPEFEEAVGLLRILALVLPLNVIGVVLTTQWLLPRGHDRRVTRVLLVAAVLNAALLLVAVEASGLRAAAWAVVAVEALVAGGIASAIRRSAQAGSTSSTTASERSSSDTEPSPLQEDTGRSDREGT